MTTVDLNTPITKVNLDIPMFISRDRKYWFEKPVRVTEQAFQVLYIYELAPIDFWFGTSSRKELLQTVKNGKIKGLMDSPNDLHAMLHSIDVLTASFDHAAKAFGLVPDWRGEPRFSAAPNYDFSFHLWAARKLDNNGTTILVSEVPFEIEYSTEQRLEVSYMQRFWAEKK